MKKKILCLAMIAIMALGIPMNANAEVFYGEDDWKVTYEKGALSSNFKGSNASEDVLTKLLPGDTMHLQIKLENKSGKTSDWYMANEVLQSLEGDRTDLGGAYTYILTYTDSKGTEETIYSNERVGGELPKTRVAAEIGLEQATNSLEKHFYLDRLEKGETIPATGEHTGGEATCKTQAVCDTCGQSYGDLNAENHEGDTEVRNAKTETCGEAGYTGDTYCLGCGEKIATGEEIPATGHNYANGVCSVCGGADPNYTPEIVLTGISAAYSGGNVAAGTAVNDLSGIVVTAHYSDGRTEAVTGYTLSGTIAAGSNTITVTYQEKTATFTVIGVSESEGESEWTIVHTLDSSDISYGSGLIANDGDTDNLAGNAQRASYLPFDLAVEYGYIYKFEFTATAENMGIAIQLYNEQAVANNSSGNPVGRANCMDAGWCVNGKEIEIPETINNSPVACVRVMFKHNAGGAVADGTITSVVISRKAV